MKPTLASLAFILVASACSSSSGTSSATVDGGSADGSTPRPATGAPPEKHRATAEACTADRPAGQTASPGGACTKDGDCAAGKNGRCFGGLQPNACSYDECAADGDCGGNGVCVCRAGGRTGQPNVCFRGNCRTDADCAGSYCSPSAVSISTDCQGVKVGSFGFFCHTPSDECRNDSDCPSPADACLLDVDAQHWKCATLLCPG